MATHDQTTKEREVIVTDNGHGHGHGDGSSVASMVMAVVGIIVVLLVGWFAIQAISSSSDDAGVEVPTEMDVNVGGDTGDTGGGEG